MLKPGACGPSGDDAVLGIAATGLVEATRGRDSWSFPTPNCGGPGANCPNCGYWLLRLWRKNLRLDDARRGSCGAS
jgi:hypothetical protein